MTHELTVLAVDFGAWTPDDWSALAGGASAVLTLFTVIIAVAAAAYAKQQVDLARQLREDQAQPFVVIDFDDNPVWNKAIDFVVENMGQTLARNVRIKIDPPFQTTLDDGAHPLPSSPLLTQPIPSLPPGKRITALFDISHQRHSAGLPMTYTATVEFEDAHGKPQEPLTYILDLSIRYSLLSFTEYRTHDAAKALKEISKTLKETRRDLRGEFYRRSRVEAVSDDTEDNDPV